MRLIGTFYTYNLSVPEPGRKFHHAFLPVKADGNASCIDNPCLVMCFVHGASLRQL